MTDKPENISSNRTIRPGMTVLDIVSTYSATQAVFKRWDARAGECICCNSLFEPLETVAEKYDLDLSALIQDLKNAV
jgi:hypothetical protein